MDIWITSMYWLEQTGMNNCYEILAHVSQSTCANHFLG